MFNLIGLLLVSAVACSDIVEVADSVNNEMVLKSTSTNLYGETTCVYVNGSIKFLVHVSYFEGASECPLNIVLDQ